MTRLAQTADLTDIQREILSTVRSFVDREIIPHAQELEHGDIYPQEIVDGLKELGIFGLMIPEEYGGLGESLLTYALVVEEIARGWMSVSGVINTHFIVAYLLRQHGTQEQKEHYLPRMATGEVRGAFSMSEPGLGSDVAAIRTKATKNADGDYIINGQKMWLTNGGSSTLVAALVRTDEGAEKRAPEPHDLPGREAGRLRRGQARAHHPRQDRQDGLQGRRHHRAGVRRLRGRRPTTSSAASPGKGFAQMMDGVEVGRVNVAARACGISIRAFELAIAYAQQRETFGKPIAQHQAIAFQLAEMAIKVEAAHLMMVNAARLKDAGKRNDVESGMAKTLASEYCAEVTTQSFRIHGGYGYSKEYEIERLMREAPFLLIGEGTSEIQKTIISRGLLKEYKLKS